VWEGDQGCGVGWVGVCLRQDLTMNDADGHSNGLLLVVRLLLIV
jgi:hypothetical protein